ncbi:maleylpyruvate isomerase N-terminal domain-containing protein [Acrocarpospora macrocephala]|uniref:maleylpyruvate isomerase N-terminal domain-containing protein n=1 Tax=Acrocarpospora macrocephala TaxID=150177 RepID=UPI0012D2D108|nr:maleylpyruvate isomerase N-terminal domain-containing protein [Acrocarpospora macrocephala]
MSTSALPMEEAARRIRVDRGLLLEELAQRSEEDLVAGYSVAGGPLGDFCESLRDLVAHVLMWDEINLAVLTEARLGRAHWSLRSVWETREAGQMLNKSGVAAGRDLPVGLLTDRYSAVQEALLAELRSYDEDGWRAPTGLGHSQAPSVGSLAQYVMSVPNVAPYWHAAVHLGRLTAVEG